MQANGRSRRHRVVGGGLLALLACFHLVTIQTVCAQVAPAQSVPAQHRPFGVAVEADAVAGQLGLLSSEDQGALTLRSSEGILTLFEGSPDAVWQARSETVAQEVSLSAPPFRRDGRWWLPVDALSFFGLTLEGGTLRKEDGSTLSLDFPVPREGGGGEGEIVDLGRGVPGLRLFAAGAAGTASQSLLLVDAGLMGLVFADKQESFDRLSAEASPDRALIMVLTAVTEGKWEKMISFSQGGQRVEARFPFRVRILSGEADMVGPDSPVLAVVLLPEYFNLRQSIQVDWAGATSTVTFRR